MLNSKLSKFLFRLKFKLVSSITGDGGHRSYYRLQGPKANYILMKDLEIKKHYKTNPKKDFLFIAIQKILKKNKVSVPSIIKLFKKESYLLIEDLGDCNIQSLKSGFLSAYKQSIDQLIKIQAIKTSSYSQTFKSSFDAAFLSKELSKSLININNFYLPKNKPSQLSQKLKTEINSLCVALGNSPFCLVHRDYHCRNIMLTKERVKIIDFQDAKPGHCLYDLASLLEDPYAELATKTKTILKNYFKKKSTFVAVNNFDWHYQAIALHRLLKAAASFIYLSKKSNNKVHNYQSKLPYAIKQSYAYAEKLARPELKLFIKQFVSKKI